MHEQRVAVRGAVRDQRARNRAGRAGPVVDDEKLPVRLVEMLRGHARQHVGRAARGKRHDNPNGLARIRLSCGLKCAR